MTNSKCKKNMTRINSDNMEIIVPILHVPLYKKKLYIKILRNHHTQVTKISFLHANNLFHLDLKFEILKI